MEQLYLHQGKIDDPWSIGWARYFPDFPADSSSLLIAIRCRFDGQREEHMALLDTGAQWSICKKELADSIGITGEDQGLCEINLSTRHGKIRGYLAKCPIEFLTEVGEELSLDATFFISDEWPGPNVIGWKGCLEAVRFAIDPSRDIIFYGKF